MLTSKGIKDALLKYTRVALLEIMNIYRSTLKKRLSTVRNFLLSRRPDRSATRAPLINAVAPDKWRPSSHHCSSQWISSGVKCSSSRHWVLEGIRGSNRACVGFLRSHRSSRDHSASPLTLTLSQHLALRLLSGSRFYCLLLDCS